MICVCMDVWIGECFDNNIKMVYWDEVYWLFIYIYKIKIE